MRSGQRTAELLASHRAAKPAAAGTQFLVTLEVPNQRNNTLLTTLHIPTRTPSRVMPSTEPNRRCPCPWGHAHMPMPMPMPMLHVLVRFTCTRSTARMSHIHAPTRTWHRVMSHRCLMSESGVNSWSMLPPPNPVPNPKAAGRLSGPSLAASWLHRRPHKLVPARRTAACKHERGRGRVT